MDRPAQSSVILSFSLIPHENPYQCFEYILIIKMDGQQIPDLQRMFIQSICRILLELRNKTAQLFSRAVCFVSWFRLVCSGSVCVQFAMTGHKMKSASVTVCPRSGSCSCGKDGGHEHTVQVGPRTGGFQSGAA